MSGITAAYVSRDAEVIKAWADAREAINAYVRETQAVLDAAGLGRYETFRNGGGWSPGKFSGLAIPQDEFPPAGWRMLERFAVPDKRYKAGKDIAAALDAVKHPGDPLLKLIGMPPDVGLGGGFTSPAVRVLENGAALYVGWRVDPDGRESFFIGRVGIDFGRWEHIPLSAYHLAIEQAEMTEAAS